MLPKAELKKWFQKLLIHTSVFALSLPTHLTVDMESWLKNILILSAFCWECRGDRVLQPKGVVTATEGGQITLACHYETDDSSPYLFWYKQRANDFPKYMLTRFKFGTGDNATEFKERFHADLDANSKSVPLTIQRVQLSDSAVYYCALRPTVTTGYITPLQKHTELHNDNKLVCTVYNTTLKLTQ
uniref:Ig-like domain-containing protein n=1 Tax=Oncorhynchus kisutch TaxID=8019 RepID=A0A8C7HP93_ONCKI